MKSYKELEDENKKNEEQSSEKEESKGPNIIDGVRYIDQEELL